MCGRYVIKTSTPELARVLGAEGTLLNTPERYNVAPTQDVPVCTLGDDEARYLQAMRWGLIPAWSKDGGKNAYSTINARGETAHQKPTFRGPFRSKRCLIPADGYYEWRKEHDTKQPYYISARSDEILLFAGLWDEWTPGDDGAPVRSCSIVTTAANEDVSDIHIRMPVLLDERSAKAWLSPQTAVEGARDLIQPAPAGTLTHIAVSTFVNSVRNDGPQCIEPRSLGTRSHRARGDGAQSGGAQSDETRNLGGPGLDR